MTFEEVKKEFEETKSTYKQRREIQRLELAKFLAGDERISKELRVVSGARAGKGLTKYESGKRFAQYDLSNWKWVEITDDIDFECIVSLNMTDIDPRSGNFHGLFDRVGLLVSYKKETSYYETRIYTDLDLPLNDDKKGEIAELVLEQYRLYQENPKENSDL